MDQYYKYKALGPESGLTINSNFPFGINVDNNLYKNQRVSLTCYNQNGGLAHYNNLSFKVSEPALISETAKNVKGVPRTKTDLTSDKEYDDTIAALQRQIEIKELENKIKALTT